MITKPVLLSGSLVAVLLAGCAGTSTGTTSGAPATSTGSSSSPAGSSSSGVRGGYGAPAGSNPSPTSASAPTGTTAVSGTKISIKAFAFNPNSLTIKVGTRVTTTNLDSATHTWTAGGGLFDSGNLPTGKSFSVTFAKPGTFNYVCSIHAFMHGGITVTP